VNSRHDLRNATESSTPKKTSSTADLFDNVEGKCAHAEGLCDSVEAGGEELGRCSCDTEGFEDSGSVVRDDVHAGEGLQEHEGKTDTHAVASAPLEELHELLLLGPVQGTPFLDLSTDITKLTHDVLMVARKATEVAQDFLGRLEIVLTCKPSRTFWAEEEHPKAEE